MMKTVSVKILLLIFLANFFYEENHQFLYKRIIYSLFIYWAVFEILKFNHLAFREKEINKLPGFYPTYLIIYSIFIVFNILIDFTNPGFNLVTLINNPQALLSVLPVLLFVVGSLSNDFTIFYKFLRAVCVIFILTWFVQLPGRIPFYQGYIASHAIIPFFLISIVDRKNIPLAITLLAAVVAFSIFSNYRIVLLKIVFFLGLFGSFNILGKNFILKVLIVCSFAFTVFLLLNNLEDMLSFFKNMIGKSDFDGADTRSFLYQELFEDLKDYELILGRGFLGTYFSDYFFMLMKTDDDMGDFYQRFGTEVGFLQLLLKGGFVFYFLYTFPLWLVALKGIFFYSHLKVPFCITIYILTELLLMFFENIPYFSFQFSLLFLFAGFAYRAMHTRSEIYQPEVMVV